MIHDSNEGIYGSFARVYDIFMDNVPYEEWGDYIRSLLEEYGIGEGILAGLMDLVSVGDGETQT